MIPVQLNPIEAGGDPGPSEDAYGAPPSLRLVIDNDARDGREPSTTIRSPEAGRKFQPVSMADLRGRAPERKWTVKEWIRPAL